MTIGKRNYGGGNAKKKKTLRDFRIVKCLRLFQLQESWVTELAHNTDLQTDGQLSGGW